MMAVRYRVATEEDIPHLRHLIPLCVRALAAGHYTLQQIESALVHVFGVDSQLIADGTYFVAVADDQLVGCGGWSKRKTLYGGDQMKTNEDNVLDPARDAARIRAFFVHPDWARQGIGARIIHLCEEAARHEGFRMLELGATLSGEAFYVAMGYTVTDRFDIVMPDGEVLPAAHMMKLLT